MALLVVGLRVADYGPGLQDIAGVGPATNRQRAARVEADLATSASDLPANPASDSLRTEDTRDGSIAGVVGFG